MVVVMLFLDHKFFEILSLDHRSMTMPSHGMVSRFYYAIIVRIDYGEMYCILRSNLNHLHYRFARSKANGNGKTEQKVTTVADNASDSNHGLGTQDNFHLPLDHNGSCEKESKEIRFARSKANGNGKTEQKVTTVADNASASSYNMVDEDDGEVEQPMVAKPSAAPDCNGVSSNKAAMAIAILWLQGIREDALKALFDQFIILQLTKNLEEKILAIVALRSFISGPDMWSLSEGLELDASMNEEVISLLNVKDRVISSH
ncbi:hypothetical protein Tco_1175862 [Tanacetum coccineum]